MNDEYLPLVSLSRQSHFDALHEQRDLRSAITSFLGLKPGFNEIAQEIAIYFLRHLDSRWAHFARLQSDARLAQLGSFGLSPEEANFLNGVSIWESWPMSFAARDGQIVVHGDRSDPRIRLPACLRSGSEELIVVAAPLSLSIKTIGVLSIGFLPSDASIKSITTDVEVVVEILALYLAGLLEGLEGSAHAIATENQLTRMSSDQRGSSLSQRQLTILGFLADGLTYDQIASRIGFSHSTVRMELMQIYRNFGVNSREEAVQWARDHELIPGDIFEPAPTTAQKESG